MAQAVGVDDDPSVDAQPKPRLSIIIRNSTERRESIDMPANFAMPSHMEFAVNKVLNFDRYTKLATRMFKVAKAGISFLDNRRRWLRSRFSMSTPNLPVAGQDLTQFVNSMMESSPDVMVVQDTLGDSRFSAHPCVTGEPHIRFYAAVALIVNDTKIGFLCLLDQKPGKKFGLREISMLLDLAGLITSVILQKQENVLSTENDIARINTSVLYNLRHPLQSALARFQDLSTAHDDWKVSLTMGSDQSRVNDYAQSFVNAVGEFSRSVSLVQDILEVCLNLATKYLEGTTYGLSSQPIHSQENKAFINTEPCDLYPYITSLQQTISRDIALCCNINWRIEDLRSMVLSTYPDVIKLIIMTTLAHISTNWKEVTVRVSYLDAETYHHTLYGGGPVSNDTRRRYSFEQSSVSSTPAARAEPRVPARTSTLLSSSSSSAMPMRGRHSAVGHVAISFQCANRKNLPRRSLRSSLTNNRQPLISRTSSTPREQAYNPAFDDVVIKNILGMVDGQVRMKSAAIGFVQKQHQGQMGMAGGDPSGIPTSPPRTSSHDSSSDTTSSPGELVLAAKYVAKWSPTVCVKERYDCYIPCTGFVRGSTPNSNVHTRVNSLVDADGSYQRVVHSAIAIVGASTVPAMPSIAAPQPSVVRSSSPKSGKPRDAISAEDEAADDADHDEDDTVTYEHDASLQQSNEVGGGLLMTAIAPGRQERRHNDKDFSQLRMDENAQFKLIAHLGQELQFMDTSTITERPDRSFIDLDEQQGRPWSTPHEDERIVASQRIKRPAGPPPSIYQTAVSAVKSIFDGGIGAKISPR